MTAADPADLLAQAGQTLAEARKLVDQVLEMLAEARIGERDGRWADRAWLVSASWSNSADTLHGPFEYAEDGEHWARSHVEPDPACVSWELTLLQPPPGPAVAGQSRFRIG